MSRNPFVGQWIIEEWKYESPLLEKAFKVKGVLSIGGAAPDEACDVEWEDADGLPCAMQGLPFDALNGTLTATPISVRLGRGPVVCSVTLFFQEPLKLEGHFTIPGDGNTGTFMADARTPPPIDAG